MASNYGYEYRSNLGSGEVEGRYAAAPGTQQERSDDEKSMPPEFRDEMDRKRAERARDRD